MDLFRCITGPKLFVLCNPVSDKPGLAMGFEYVGENCVRCKRDAERVYSFLFFSFLFVFFFLFFFLSCSSWVVVAAKGFHCSYEDYCFGDGAEIQ